MFRKIFYLVLVIGIVLTTNTIVSSQSQKGSQQGNTTTFLPLIAHNDAPEETIQILEPGTASRLISPIHLSGMADPTYEQNLVVRIYLLDGTLLIQTFTTIQSPAGERGPFSVDIPFNIVGEQQAVIQVYSESARDGGITHLASVIVTLADSGPENILPGANSTERLTLYQPNLAKVISGGVAHVEGFGFATFEQHLLIEILDENGTVIGSAPVTLSAPELGLPGSFSIDISYTLNTSGPGRILVHDPSPAFMGDVHITSVEISLEP